MGAGATVAGTLGLVAESVEAAPVALGSKPSVLLIVLDDMPDRLVSVMENTLQLADQGTRFMNAYTAIPLCGPNRAAILTGLFPHTSKVTTNSAWSQFSSIGHNAFTFVKALNDAGYDTALCGKYMNGREGSMTSVPAGYYYWFELSSFSTHGPDGFDVSDNGRVVGFRRHPLQLVHHPFLYPLVATAP
jgi:arylsulfatase A-like enzyme